MKKVLLIVAVTFMSTLSFAQDNVVNKGDFIMNIGGGISNGPSGHYNNGYKGYGFGHSYGVMPSFNVAAEVGMFPTGDVGIVTLGGIVAMGFSGSDNVYYGNSSYLGVDVMFRGAWHLSKWNNKTWDVYGGIDTGIRFNSFTYDDNDFNASDVDFKIGVFVGGRWMMSESFGLFVEVATSELALAKFGVTLKF